MVWVGVVYEKEERGYLVLKTALRAIATAQFITVTSGLMFDL